jgi:hypothetical protein
VKWDSGPGTSLDSQYLVVLIPARDLSYAKSRLEFQ